MSGGAWGYRSHEFEELAEQQGLVPASLRLLGQIEHELDWGVCADTCKGCADLRVVAALEQFYEDGHERDALLILRDRDRLDLTCSRCLASMPRRLPRRPDDVLAEAERELARREAA